MDTLKKIQKVTDFLLIAAIIIYFLLMFGFTNANVFTRRFLNNPIVISNEVARYSYVAIIFIGAIFTMRADKHLSLDFFVARMPRSISFAVTTAGRVLTEIFLAIFFVYAIQMTIAGMSTPATATQLPMALYYVPLLVGAIGMFLEEAILIVVRIGQFKTHTLPLDLEKQAEQEQRARLEKEDRT